MIIKFQPFDENIKDFVLPPKPAINYIPEWYRNAPLRMDGDKVDGLSKTTNATSNLTIKGCSPFLDALSFGYIYELPADIEFRKHESGNMSIRWAAGLDLLGGHTADQYVTLPTSYDGFEGIFKWKFTYKIITPKGYSCLFTHPLNRNELPFRTLSGVVDTDGYPGPVEFPFQMLKIIKEDIFILEKGTPLCQIIPFKRDDWNSKNLEYDEKAYSKAHFDIKSKIVRSYKKQWWNRKSFK